MSLCENIGVDTKLTSASAFAVFITITQPRGDLAHDRFRKGLVLYRLDTGPSCTRRLLANHELKIVTSSKLTMPHGCVLVPSFLSHNFRYASTRKVTIPYLDTERLFRKLANPRVTLRFRFIPFHSLPPTGRLLRNVVCHDSASSLFSFPLLALLCEVLDSPRLYISHATESARSQACVWSGIRWR